MLRELAAQAARPEVGDESSALRSHGSLVRAIEAAAAPDQADPGLPLLAELKLASPSAGRLLHGAAQPYLDAVRRGGACGISAVTAGGRFQGSLDVLRTAHAAGLPTLMKDFITEEAQLDAAVHHGASAVLLIERLLAGEGVGPGPRETLVRAAHDRGLEVLLEVHGPREAKQAMGSRADLLGVNSRDLDSLAVDVPAALQVVRRLADAGRPALLLSGVTGPAQAEAARAAAAAGILVGTALVGARDPATAARALRRSVAKVCGNRTGADVEAARGADLVGVIVAAGSPRDVPLDDAALLLRQAERQGSASVAVTRRQSQDALVGLARALRPTFLQVHGDLSVETVANVQALGVGVLHAIVPGATPTPGCDGTVTDSSREGGSGTVHTGVVPTSPGLHLVAGGLDSASAAAAVLRSGSAGADASSRLETDGCKDPAQVADFIAAAQRAARRPHGA